MDKKSFSDAVERMNKQIDFQLAIMDEFIALAKKREMESKTVFEKLLHDLTGSHKDKPTLNHFTNMTNRSINQTMFLFRLVNCDLNVLLALEEKCANNLLHWSPSTKEEVAQILAMGNKFGVQLVLNLFRFPVTFRYV